MESFMIKIGDHLIQVKPFSDRIRAYMMRHFRNVPGGKKEPALSICIEEGYGIPFINYDMDVRSQKGKIEYRRADYFLVLDWAEKKAHLKVHDEFALKHAMTNLYSVFIVQTGWGLLIHSSCVHEQGKAYLFAGRSGAGKSTVVRLSEPRPILSDEATVVKISEDSVGVYDSPFRSDLMSEHSGRMVPLAGIQILRQSMQINQVKISPIDALFLLMDKVFYWTHHPSETKDILSLCRRLVKQVPVYELQFQKNPAFWEAISS